MDRELFREIMKFAVEKAREITDKQKALEVKYLYKEFDKQIGKVLYVGEYIQYDDKLYEVIQEHTAQADWTPDISKSIFVVIDKEHQGTIDDPIPAQENMIYYNGKYYIENEILYLCVRDSEIALQFMPSVLVGNYFELVGDEGGVDEDTTVGDNEGNNEGNVEGDIEEGNNNGGSTEGDIENGENNGNIEEGDAEEGDSNGDIDEGTNEEIIEEGTIENPIIVENPTAGMNYVADKYYKCGDIVYHCIREGYLYHDPSALVGNYFEIV